MVLYKANKYIKNSAFRWRRVMRTRALTLEEAVKILELIKNGFKYIENGKNKIFRPKENLYYILLFQINTGLRIGDILSLKRKDISTGRIDIIEKKTKKALSRPYPENTYNFINKFCEENRVKYNDLVFGGINIRTVQKNLKTASLKLGLRDISTHSFRKTFATLKYKESNNNIELIRRLLNHSSTTVTQRYLGISDPDLEKISNRVILKVKE